MLRTPLLIPCVLFSAVGAQAQDRFPSWLQPCDDAVPGALCGTYEVWEDREAQTGRRIELFVMVLPATGPGPYGAPVVPLAGGPGQGASDSANFATTLIGPLRETRDVVLLDQRGTGRSHRLDCGVLPPGAPLQARFEDFPTVAFARDCLEKQDADVSLYTTEMAVGDLEELRDQLGYPQLDLIGGSYGTRVALHYMRRYPEHVRSAVLDGVSPPNSEYQAQFAPAFERTLAFLFDRCAGDPQCAAAYPELRSDWDRALDRFTSNAVTIVATHPETGDEEPISFSRGLFVDTVRRMLYGAQQWPRVVKLIHAAAGGDFSDFVTARYYADSAVRRSFGLGMLLTISCTESVPFISEDEIEQVTVGTSLGSYRASTIRKACEVWPAGTVPADWSKPISVDTPILILSGAVDPATPSWVAAETAARLPNSKHVIVPNRSHAPTDFGCENGVIQAFLESGNAHDLDVGCLEATAWPEFEPMAEPLEEVSVDVAELRSCEGSYELQPGFVLVITLDEDRLFIQPPGEAKRALRPMEGGEFFVEGLGMRIMFERNEQGAVDGFQLQNGPRAKRVK